MVAGVSVQEWHVQGLRAMQHMFHWDFWIRGFPFQLLPAPAFFHSFLAASDMDGPENYNNKTA
jgi:hypothetical protein